MNQSDIDSKKQSIRFYPEGGSMLENASGLVAFKAEDAETKILKVKGVIIASNGDTITHFDCKEGDSGLFMLMPVSGMKYTAIGLLNDKIPFAEILPDALSKGFNVRVTDAGSVFKVIVSTNEATLAESRNHQLELKARHGGLTHSAFKFKMDILQRVASFSKKNIPSGITSITLTDEQGKAHCERLVFFNPENPITVQVTSDKSIYKSKEHVIVNVKTLDSQKNPVKSEVSLAVVDADLVPENAGDIVSYLMLESELRGKIADPKRYFDVNNAKRFKELDLLLLTQGWRDFIWKRMRDTSLLIKNINEMGFTVSGIVTENNSSKPLPGINVTLLANGAKVGKLLSQKTNQQGHFFSTILSWKGHRLSSSNQRITKQKVRGKYLLTHCIANPWILLFWTKQDHKTLVCFLMKQS